MAFGTEGPRRAPFRAMAMWLVLGVVLLYTGALVLSTARNPGAAKRTSLEDLLVPSATTTTAVQKKSGGLPAGGTAAIRPVGELEVRVNGLNLRAGPNRRSAVLTVLRKGDKLSILGKSSGWYQVYVPGSEKKGYVSSSQGLVRVLDR